MGQDFIKTLKAKYQEARHNERQAMATFERFRRLRQLYAQVLSEEGFDVRSLEEPSGPELGFGKSSIRLFEAKIPETNGNGHKEASVGDNVLPLSDTHALYLLIRKHGNKGFTFEELKALSDEAGYGLTEEVIKNTFWKQTRSKRMEKMENGRIVLTPAGQLFNSFRAPISAKDEAESIG